MLEINRNKSYYMNQVFTFFDSFYRCLAYMFLLILFVLISFIVQNSERHIENFPHRFISFWWEHILYTITELLTKWHPLIECWRIDWYPILKAIELPFQEDRFRWILFRTFLENEWETPCILLNFLFCQKRVVIFIGHFPYSCL